MDASNRHSVVVICTRNRPADLARALECTQDSAPGIEMLVADSSDAGREQQVEEVVRPFPTCTLLRCEPGLARQRNDGLNWLRKERPEALVVHFIDDDTEPLDGYFESIERVFDNTPDVGGVGGIILGESLPRFDRIKRIFGLTSSHAGVVLPSGRTTMSYYEDWVPTAPQRLAGCTMSYRMSAIEHLEFDDRLEGYSFGEDVYFSYALSETHRLVVEPSAKVRHHLSPTNRQSQAAIARDSIRLRHRFVRENKRRGLRLSAFWRSVVFDMLLRFAKGVATVDRDSLAVAKGIASGAIDTLRDPLPIHVSSP